MFRNLLPTALAIVVSTAAYGQGTPAVPSAFQQSRYLDTDRFEAAVERFRSDRQPWAAQVEARLPAYRDLFQRASAQHGVPYELLVATCGVESGLDPFAVSNEGAAGICQIMPSLAADQGWKFHGNAKSRGWKYADALRQLRNGKSLEALAALDWRFDVNRAIPLCAARLAQFANGDYGHALKVWHAGPNGAKIYNETRNFINSVPAMWQYLFKPDAPTAPEQIAPQPTAAVAALALPPTILPIATQAVMTTDTVSPFTFVGSLTKDLGNGFENLDVYTCTPTAHDTAQSIRDRFLNATLPFGDGTKSGADFREVRLRGPVVPGAVLEVHGIQY